MSLRSTTLLAISMPAVALAVISVAPERVPKAMIDRLPEMLRPGALPASGPAIIHESQPAAKGSVRKRVQSSGTVRPLVTVQVGSQLSGQIQQLKVDFNSEVKAGDVLAVLDAKTLVARVDQAAADLEMAKSALANQIANREKAEAIVRQAERAKGRHRELGQKGLSAATQVDSAIRDAEVAAAELSIANAQIASARSNIVQRQAVLAQARIDLERAEIRAPIGGVVISRTVDVGQTVAASLQAPELFRIAQDLRHIRIEALVSEADIGGVAKGNPVAFRVDAHPGRQFDGKVAQVRLSGVEEQNVVSYTVVIEASNSDLALYPGMTAHVEIETARRDNVVRVPAEALRYRPRGVATEAAVATDDGPKDKTARREHQLERLARQLGLSEAQIAQAKQRLAAITRSEKATRSKSKDADAGGGGGQAATAKPSSSDVLARALESLLDDKQATALAAWKSERARSRTGTVWALGADGALSPRPVRIGLVDGRHAEVLGGVEEGEQIVVRSRSATGSRQASAHASSTQPSREKANGDAAR